jgi:hypothetical protein
VETAGRAWAASRFRSETKAPISLQPLTPLPGAGICLQHGAKGGAAYPLPCPPKRVNPSPHRKLGTPLGEATCTTLSSQGQNWQDNSFNMYKAPAWTPGGTCDQEGAKTAPVVGTSGTQPPCQYPLGLSSLTVFPVFLTSLVRKQIMDPCLFKLVTISLKVALYVLPLCGSTCHQQAGYKNWPSGCAL